MLFYEHKILNLTKYFYTVVNLINGQDPSPWDMFDTFFFWFSSWRTVNVCVNVVYEEIILRIRRKIRLIECNAKCCFLKKLTCKRTLQQVFYLS